MGKYDETVLESMKISGPSQQDEQVQNTRRRKIKGKLLIRFKAKCYQTRRHPESSNIYKV